MRRKPTLAAIALFGLAVLLAFLLRSSAPPHERAEPVHEIEENRRHIPVAREVEDREEQAGETDSPPPVIPAADRSSPPPGTGVRVRVTDKIGRPRAGVRVALGRIERVTGPDGLFEMLSLTATEWRLTVRAGDLTRVATLKLPKDRVWEVEVVVPLQGTVVEGTVRDRRSGPIPRATVTLSRSVAESHEYLRGQTDEQGRYRIECVPAGTFAIEVWGPSMPTERAGHLIVGTEATLRRDLTLGAVTLSGVVRESVSGRPIPEVSVTVQRTGWFRTKTDAEGAYRLLGLPPGKATLVFEKDGYGLKIEHDVEIVALEERTLDVALRRSARLHVWVTDETGRPAEGPMHIVMGGMSTGIRTGPDGHALFRKIAPGDYRLFVLRGKSHSEPQEVAVRSGDNTVRFVLRTEESKPIALKGVVVDAATGGPLGGVRITASGPTRRSARTDTRGRFAIRDARAGTYRLQLSKAGYGFRIVGPFEVGAAEPEDLVIRLTEAAVVRFRLRDLRGKPVTGRVFVDVEPAEGSGWGTGIIADAAGVASCDQLVPGVYRLSLATAGKGSATVETAIRPGDNVVEVQLQRGG
jgi:hypothetical protein